MIPPVLHILPDLALGGGQNLTEDHLVNVGRLDLGSDKRFLDRNGP